VGYPQPGAPGTGQQTNGLAITALVLGIVGILGNICCFGGILSPVAIVLGFMGRKKADGSGGQVGGRGLAQAGMILGIIGTVIFLAWIVFFIVAIANGNDFNYQYSNS
jgi:hypothetical protein